MEIGISIAELNLLTIGMILDMWPEKANDNAKDKKLAGQAELDMF